MHGNANTCGVAIMTAFDTALGLLKSKGQNCSHCSTFLNENNHTLDDGVDFPRVLCDVCYKKAFYYFNEDLIDDSEEDTWWEDNA